MRHAAYPDLPETHGTYFILNTANRRIYIGETGNLRQRIALHFSSLKSNGHHNSLLQSDWNGYGPSAFEYGVLADKTSDPTIGSFETFYVNLYQADDPALGYNTTHFIKPNIRSQTYIQQVEALAQHWGISGRRHTNEVLRRCLAFAYEQIIEA